MTTPDQSAAFRRRATVVFRLFVAALLATAAGLAVLGWWLFGWWGLAAGAVLGIVLSAVGLIGGTLLYAMSQDGG